MQTAFEVLQNVGGEAGVVCHPKDGVGVGRTTKGGNADAQTPFEFLQNLGGEVGVVCNPKDGVGVGRTTLYAGPSVGTLVVCDTRVRSTKFSAV